MDGGRGAPVMSEGARFMWRGVGMHRFRVGGSSCVDGVRSTASASEG